MLPSAKEYVTNKLNPVLCGSAFKNKGVQQLLDAVVNWMPSPLDRGNIKAHDLATDADIILTPSDDAPFAALAFKIMSDPYVGRLTFIRIYSGTLSKGMSLINSTKDSKERISRLLEMHANKREERDEFYHRRYRRLHRPEKSDYRRYLCSPRQTSAA